MDTSNINVFFFSLNHFIVERKVLTPENAITWGVWVNAIISLIVVGLVMFMIVKAYNKSKKPAADAPVGPTDNDLLIEIRDALKK